MRTLLAVLLLGSVQAFACPNLTGSFTCTYSDGSSEVLNITQEAKEGVTTYNINQSLTPADNVIYTVPDDETLKEGTFRAWCNDDVTLKGELIGKYYDQGSFFGDLLLNIDYSLDGANLKQVTTGTLTSANGQYPINAETVCTPTAP